MTPPTLDAEPACPGPRSVRPRCRRLPRRPRAAITTPSAAGSRDIPRATWDALAARTPWATPFSGWAFQRAWWDAYGDERPRGDPRRRARRWRRRPSAEPIAIVPLMHRHEVEPSDALTHTTMRHGATVELTPVEPTATAVFFGASYHADYATILAAPADLPVVAEAVADYLADTARPASLGRRRPAPAALRRPGRRRAGRGVRCPRDRRGLDAQRRARGRLPGRDAARGRGHGRRTSRRSARRSATRSAARSAARRRSARSGSTTRPIRSPTSRRSSTSTRSAGATSGSSPTRRAAPRAGSSSGGCSSSSAPTAPLRLTFLTVGGRRIAAGIHFETPDGYLYYNAGVDPDARDLSPGVLMVYAYVQRALAAGKRRLDFLRGDEPYKYEWGAVDEPIQRLLVRRRDG